MKAYTLSGGVYTLVSLTKWTLNAYTGETGELPNSEWATWDPTGGGKYTGTFTSNADGANMDEPLDVLTPNRAIYRIIFTEASGSDGTPALQFYGTLPKGAAALPFAPAAAGALDLGDGADRASPAWALRATGRRGNALRWRRRRHGGGVTGVTVTGSYGELRWQCN